MAKGTKKTSRIPLLLALIVLFLGFLLGVLFLQKLSVKPQQPSIQSYTGTLPCADCSGLVTTLTLIKQTPQAKMGTYILHEVYEGKNTKPFITQGTWTITTGNPTDSNAQILTLSHGKDSPSYYLMIGASAVQLLDNNKQKIDSPFNETLIALQETQPSLANPASVNCVKQGGTLTIQKRGDGGEYGLCEFEDNRACEEWALYRKECPVGGVKTTGFDTIEQKYCAWVGGQTIAAPNATCTLPNKNVCTDRALYNGTCQ